VPHNNCCVWIDHREARIFDISVDSADEMTIRDPHAPLHIHRRADHVHLGKAPPDKDFFDEVAGKLGGFRGIIVVGPGTARTEFAGHIAHDYPMLAKRIWGIEPMDHPSDAQIVAAARKSFRAANRMHQS